MCDGHSSPVLTPTTSSEGSGAALSRANTIDKALDLADCLGHALTFPDSISDPHLRALLEVLQEDLPDQIYDAMMRVIHQMLGKEVELSAAEFQRYLGFLTRDNVGELRRACLRGKAQLYAMGWRPRSGTAVAPEQQQSEANPSHTGTSTGASTYTSTVTSTDTANSTGLGRSEPACPPMDSASQAARALVAAAAADRRAKHAPISSRKRAICKASMRSALGRLRTEPTPVILDDCERRLATLKMAF